MLTSPCKAASPILRFDFNFYLEKPATRPRGRCGNLRENLHCMIFAFFIIFFYFIPWKLTGTRPRDRCSRAAGFTPVVSGFSPPRRDFFDDLRDFA